MSEIANLEIKVSTDGVARAEQAMRKFSSAGVDTEKQLRAIEQQQKANQRELDKHASALQREAQQQTSLVGSLKTLAAGYIGLSTAIAGVRKLVAVTREFEVLNAGLITATGSIEGAAVAFEALEGFASTTPYSLQQSVEAFTKLRNMGLTPSERALRSYGNTASSMGKELSMMIEAVADATVGEFERLKEFGIKGKTQGDNITLTFRGISTTMKKEASAIEGYLIKLGEANFGGAMAERMKTLDGALSNLGDTWNKMFREMGKGSIGDVIKDVVATATEALEGLIGFIQGGKLSAAIDEMRQGFVRVAADADFAWQVIKLASPAAWMSGNVENPVSAWNRTRDTAVSLNDRSGASLRSRHAAELDAERAQLTASGSMAFNQTGGIPGYYAAFAPQARSSSSSASANGKKGYEVPGVRGQDSDFAKAASDRDKELQAMIDKEARLSKLEADRIEKEAQRKRQVADSLKEVEDGYRTEEQILQDSLGRKRQIIEDAYAENLITARDREALMTKVAVEEEQKRQQKAMENYANIAAAGQELFGNLATAAKGWGGEQSGVYKAMFAAQKAFAIASATVSIALSIAEARKHGWPLGIAYGLEAAAKGAQIMAMISGANFSGAYDAGGFIPAGGVGIVGERGPEFVRGPAQVTSRVDTARALGGAQIRIINAPDQAAAAQFMSSAAGEQVFLNLIRRHATTVRQMIVGGG